MAPRVVAIKAEKKAERKERRKEMYWRLKKKAELAKVYRPWRDTVEELPSATPSPSVSDFVSGLNARDVQGVAAWGRTAENFHPCNNLLALSARAVAIIARLGARARRCRTDRCLETFNDRILDLHEQIDGRIKLCSNLRDD